MNAQKLNYLQLANGELQINFIHLPDDPDKEIEISVKARLVNPNTYQIDNTAVRWDIDNNLVHNTNYYFKAEASYEGPMPHSITLYLFWRREHKNNCMMKGL